jgi:15-cis-phytoene synthase
LGAGSPCSPPSQDRSLDGGGAEDPTIAQPGERSTYLAGEARLRDPDRYLCALFAPAAHRDAFLGLVLFNHELARIPGAVNQPVAGYIRYQWWREAVDELAAGKPARRHPVVAELAAALERGWAAPDQLRALVEAREQALEQVEVRDLAALELYVAGTSGALQALLYAALGGRGAGEADAATSIGTAFGLLGVAGAVSGEAAEGRPEAGASGHLAQANRAMLDRAESLLRAGRERAGRPPREHMAAFLLVPLARHHLARIRRRGAGAPPAPELAWPALAPLRLLARTLARRP